MNHRDPAANVVEMPIVRGVGNVADVFGSESADMVRVLEDRQLAAMTADPPHDLVPVLRARGMAPLVVALSILPALMVMQYRTFSQSSIILFLRALGCVESNSASEWLTPGISRFGESIALQPPLSAWIEGVWMRLLPFAAGSSQTFVCLLATSCVVLAVYSLAGPWMGQRFALIASVLLCFHPVLLTITRASPRSILGIACLLWSVAFWFDALRQTQQRRAVKRILGAGIAWGLGWLSAGPVSLVLVPITLVIFMAGLRQRHEPVHEGESKFSAWFRLQLFLIWLIAGVVVGGWWPALVVKEFGSDALTSWMEPESLWPVRRSGLPLYRDAWWAGMPFLAGWILLGLARRFWSLKDADRSFQVIVGGWIATLCGLFCLPGSPLPWSSVAQALLLVPLVLIAAAGLESFLARDISSRWIGLGIAISGAASVYVYTGQSVPAIVIGLLILVAAAWWATTAEWTGRLRFPWRNEDLQMILRVLMVVWIGGQFYFSGKYLLRRTQEDIRLDSFWARLSMLSRPDRVILLVPDPGQATAVEVMIHRRFPKIDVKRISTQNRELGLATESQGLATDQIVLVEWVRRPHRLPAEVVKSWRVLPVGDPLIIQDRRLSVYQLNPHGVPARGKPWTASKHPFDSISTVPLLTTPVRSDPQKGL